MKLAWLLLVLFVAVPAALANSGAEPSGTNTEEGSPMLMMALAAESGYQPPALDCQDVTGTVVAIDVSKNQIPADAQQFIDDLVSAGYTVRMIDVSTPEGRDSLSCVNILVIWSLSGNYGISGTYSNIEVTAIHDFVTYGGGFFFLSDWGTFATSTANLIAAFNIVVDANMVYDNNNYDSSTYWPIYESDNFISSPLFDGVDGYEQLAGTSFVVGQGNPLVPVVITDDDGSATPGDVPVVAAGFYGNGCMVVTGDTNWMHNVGGYDGYGKQDNGVFAMNIVDFLTECNPSDVNVPEFGAISAGIALVGAGLALFLIRRH